MRREILRHSRAFARPAQDDGGRGSPCPILLRVGYSSPADAKRIRYNKLKLYWNDATSRLCPLKSPPPTDLLSPPKISIASKFMKYLCVHGGVSVMPGKRRKVVPLGL